jgi:hypothetical protein
MQPVAAHDEFQSNDASVIPAVSRQLHVPTVSAFEGNILLHHATHVAGSSCWPDLWQLRRNDCVRCVAPHIALQNLYRLAHRCRS